MAIEWIVATSLAAWWSTYLAHRLVRTALPPCERVDFQHLGTHATWNIERTSSLPGPVGDFVRRVSAENADADRIDLVCEKLGEVDEQTTQIPERLTRLARCVAALGGAISVLMVSRAIGQQGGLAAAAGGGPILIGGAAAFRCWWLGRAAKDRLTLRRQNWDALSRCLLKQSGASCPTSVRGDQPGGPGETFRGRLNHTVGRLRQSVRDFPNYRRIQLELPVEGSDPSYARLCLAWGRCFHRG